MAGVLEDCGAFDETVVFLKHFEELPDGRQAGKVRYPLSEVLVLCLLGILAGAETICDIARFGDKKLALLRRFRPFEAGPPPRTITSAISWPRSTPRLSSAALSPGSHP